MYEKFLSQEESNKYWEELKQKNNQTNTKMNLEQIEALAQEIEYQKRVDGKNNKTKNGIKKAFDNIMKWIKQLSKHPQWLI